jgi:hypothetical protein
MMQHAPEGKPSFRTSQAISVDVRTRRENAETHSTGSDLYDGESPKTLPLSLQTGEKGASGSTSSTSYCGTVE